MLRYNPKERITASEALNDQWVTKFTKNKVKKALGEQLLQNLKSFNSERKLQSAIVSYIANQLVSKEEEIQIRQIFESLDENGDGVLSKEELVKGMDLLIKRTGKQTGSYQDVDELIKKIDLNGDGQVDIKEFIAAMINLKDANNGNFLKQAFDLFDIDGNGQITKKEL